MVPVASTTIQWIKHVTCIHIATKQGLIATNLFIFLSLAIEDTIAFLTKGDTLPSAGIKTSKLLTGVTETWKKHSIIMHYKVYNSAVTAVWYELPYSQKNWCQIKFGS